uniref:PHD-type domain-containing protein n=1 Tax=Strigamia maritima TaxID=126957 RepID=T1IW75_STRMM
MPKRKRANSSSEEEEEESASVSEASVSSNDVSTIVTRRRALREVDDRRKIGLRRNVRRLRLKSEEESCCECLQLIDDKEKMEFLICAKCKTSRVHLTCAEMPHQQTRRSRLVSWYCLKCSCCTGCKNAKDLSTIVRCGTCSNPFHLYCVQPKLRHKPIGKWTCDNCQEKSDVKTSPLNKLKKDTVVYTAELSSDSDKNGDIRCTRGFKAKTNMGTKIKQESNSETGSEVSVGRPKRVTRLGWRSSRDSESDANLDNLKPRMQTRMTQQNNQQRQGKEVIVKGNQNKKLKQNQSSRISKASSTDLGTDSDSGRSNMSCRKRKPLSTRSNNTTNTTRNARKDVKKSLSPKEDKKCPIPGCNSNGHLSGKFSRHSAIFACPIYHNTKPEECQNFNERQLRRTDAREKALLAINNKIGKRSVTMICLRERFQSCDGRKVLTERKNNKSETKTEEVGRRYRQPNLKGVSYDYDLALFKEAQARAAEDMVVKIEFCPFIAAK